MIERVGKCLKIGGHEVLRGPKKSLRSRRCLHNAFWSHGAGNIDLPSWWILLLQTPEQNNGPRLRNSVNAVGEKVSGVLQEMFLDFLYPVHTLALMRHLKRTTNAHYNATSTTRNAASSIKHYSRNYTSIAESLISGDVAFEEENPEVQMHDVSVDCPAPFSRNIEAMRRRIDEILEIEDQTRLYDELWQNYQDLLETSHSLSPPELIKLFRSLGRSKRTKDLERSVALFESLPIPHRRAIHYSHAVSAALALKDLDTALSFHEEARSRISGSIGTAAILDYTIQNELWQRAISIWHQYWSVSRMVYFASRHIWTTVDALPLTYLIEKAISAASFAISLSGTADREAEDGAGAARDFALELTQRCFSRQDASFDIPKHRTLLQKAKLLVTSNTRLSTMALNQLLVSKNREHGHHALHIYRMLRKEACFKPDNRLLCTITDRVLQERITLGLFMVIDDWRRYFGRIPKSYMLDIAEMLAKNGELESVQKLFDDYYSEYGAPQTNSLYHSMLLAHNRRADINGITRALNKMGEDHGYKPDIIAYNFVISTFARIGDVEGARSWFRKLDKKGLKPNSHTYSSLMSMYGKRGDLDALNDMYQMSKAEGITADVGMVDSLVLANINQEDLGEAERLVKEFSKIDMEGSRAFIWNNLLNAHALRKNVEKVSELHGQMQEAGVAPDNMTYAALMTSLTIAKHPNAANKLLQKVMPRANMKRTALHYAIVMGGYLATKEYGEVFRLYKDMVERSLRPTMSTQNVLIRAAAAIDMSHKDQDAHPEDPTIFTRAQQTFEQTLATLDPLELAAHEPRKFAGPNPVNEAFSSTYFEYLIFLYGKEGAFDKVTELYDRFIKTTSQYTHHDIKASPPVRLLTALMVAYRKAGNQEEVEKCWNLALDKSQKLASHSKSATHEPGWVMKSRRFIINLPLRQYILSLSPESRVPAPSIAKLNATITHLLSCGYALNSPNWNLYTQVLARSPHPDHQALAFRICERELIADWPGWAHLGDPEYMKPKIRSMTRHTLLVHQKRMPAYLTFVWLAKAWVQARNRRSGATGSWIAGTAPRTVDAVVNMPRVEDGPQKTILRPD